MGKVTVSGFLIAPTLAEADRVSHLVAEHVRLSLAEPGCLHFELVRSQSDPTRFALLEIFRDRAALDAHQARTRTSVWYAATKTLERQFSIEES